MAHPRPGTALRAARVQQPQYQAQHQHQQMASLDGVRETEQARWLKVAALVRETEQGAASLFRETDQWMPSLFRETD